MEEYQPELLKDLVTTEPLNRPLVVRLRGPVDGGSVGSLLRFTSMRRGKWGCISRRHGAAGICFAPATISVTQCLSETRLFRASEQQQRVLVAGHSPCLCPSHPPAMPLAAPEILNRYVAGRLHSEPAPSPRNGAMCLRATCLRRWLLFSALRRAACIGGMRLSR